MSDKLKPKQYCVVRRWKDNQSHEQFLENFHTVEEARVYAGSIPKDKDYKIEVMKWT